ncbi:DJ-1/PfpI family protein [Streptomyces sp. NPDC096097]|uniref:DJ-1/PfpI family protein n=1 Tax=Streptomyces sp. NPDC096097 TaxID=3155546 RepID=UPI003329A08C
MRVAFPVAPEGVEEIELTEPRKAVLEAGWNPQLVSTEPGRTQAFHHLDKAGRHPLDRVLAGRTAESFDALVLPGGVADPDALRLDPLAARSSVADPPGPGGALVRPPVVPTGRHSASARRTAPKTFPVGGADGAGRPAPGRVPE